MAAEKAWEKFGRSDPYFGVISDPIFREAHQEGDARDAFFRSGEEHVERILRIVDDNVAPGFSPQRALDFGCGVGRVTLPLARVANKAVGVDVSGAMLAEARRNAHLAGVDNVEWIESTRNLEGVPGEFDFIHTYIVLQHIRPRRGEVLLKALLGRLAMGGVGAIHLTFSKRISWPRRIVQGLRKHVPVAHNIANLLQRRSFGYPLMEMNSYSMDRVLLMLLDADCHSLHLRFTDHGGYIGAFLFFRKARLASL